jgi:excisionase family DNA binding protein
MLTQFVRNPEEKEPSNMSTPEKVLSATKAAGLCGVERTTIGYWIRSKKLRANRVGRNYSIPVEELLFFLKSTGQKIPHELAEENSRRPFFRSFQNCWLYWQGTAYGKNCKGCAVFKNHLNVCFTVKGSGSLCGSKRCDECQYYQETYLPRIQFIYQIDLPAAVYMDFCFWGGNRKWAQLCEVQEKDLIGMGLEHVVHPDSLETVISDSKRRALGDPDVPGTFTIFMKNNRSGKLKVRNSVYPLNDPAGTFLLLAEPEEG